jgi:hypothetical protein
MPAIAFFPWVRLDQAVELGSLRLLPYARGKLPGDLLHANQRDIDGVLGAYATHGQQRIRHAALLEVGNWKTGTDADAAVTDLFSARRAIGFAALAERRLFTHFEYCNYDTYALIVQRYHAGATESFSFTTRRRDGGTTQMWSSSSFAFHRPNHIDANATMRLDAALLEALLSLSTPANAHLLEAMDEFNLANTDSSDVPMHTEVVMLKSAFEWMFQIDERASSLVNAITELLADLPPAKPTTPGALHSAWTARWPQARRPLEAWVRDFCAVRGSAAHGKNRAALKTVFNSPHHLAFGSYLFPMLFRKKLAANGVLRLPDVVAEQLRRIDSYLEHDPFSYDMGSGKSHPWHSVDADAMIAAKAHLFYGDNDS